MKNPLVSVIIPTYNRALLLDRAIQSVGSGTYSNYEIVVVDDASNDNTSQVVKNYPVKYFKLKQNLGEVGARNFGIKQASGELITFLDSDDELTPNSIKDRVRAYYASGYKTPLIYGDFLLNGESRNFVDKEGIQYKYLLKELSLCGIVSVLVNKNALLKSGLPKEKLPSWGDDDLIIKYAKNNPIYHISSVVALIHTSTDSASIDQTKNRIGCEIMVGTYKDEIIKIHGYFRYFLWQVRIFRLKVLEYKQKLISKPSLLNHVGILAIRIFMFILDKILYLWFDNIFV